MDIAGRWASSGREGYRTWLSEGSLCSHPSRRGLLAAPLDEAFFAAEPQNLMVRSRYAACPDEASLRLENHEARGAICDSPARAGERYHGPLGSLACSRFHIRDPWCNSTCTTSTGDERSRQNRNVFAQMLQRQNEPPMGRLQSTLGFGRRPSPCAAVTLFAAIHGLLTPVRVIRM
jgi:hypothetical protein